MERSYSASIVNMDLIRMPVMPALQEARVVVVAAEVVEVAVVVMEGVVAPVDVVTTL